MTIEQWEKVVQSKPVSKWEALPEEVDFIEYGNGLVITSKKYIMTIAERDCPYLKENRACSKFASSIERLKRIDKMHSIKAELDEHRKCIAELESELDLLEAYE